MGPRRLALLLMLAAGPACGQPPVPPAPAETAAKAETGPGKRIFLPPPLRWDSAMLAVRPALQQTAADFANLTGGLAFGMSVDALNAKLAEPHAGLSWSGLSLANEFPGEARMFGVPFGTAGVLRLDATGCAGANSFLVFLFRPNGLFRISYRLTADKTCPDADEAARQIFARYVPLGPAVAYATRYKAGSTQVIDITDPLADGVVAIRWHPGVN